MKETKLYFFEPYAKELVAPWFAPGKSGFIESIKGVANPFNRVTRVNTLTEADAAFAQNNFRSLDQGSRAYLKACIDHAELAGKRVFIFSCGDFTDTLVFDPRAYVFRLSLYASMRSARDIIMPTITEDIGAQSLVIRSKSEKPVVSFCGQGRYATAAQWVKYYLKVWMQSLGAVFVPTRRARIIGMYWRRITLSAFRGTNAVKTNFIVRDSFSGALRTIGLAPEKARAEFIDSIIQSDFVLAPKGDGNYSNRFLETLALGRIPVLIDTDVVLPLEGRIDYTDVVVRVPMQEVSRTPAHIRAWYDALTADAYERRQKTARALFGTRLRFDAFFETFFTEVLPSLPLLQK